MTAPSTGAALNTSELRAMLAAATPGPWRWTHGMDARYMILAADPSFRVKGEGYPDAVLIAAAVNNLEALLDAADERDRMLVVIDQYEAGGCHYRHQQGDTEQCNACAAAHIGLAALATDTTTEDS